MADPVLASLCFKYGPDVGRLIFGYWDETTFLTVVCKAYLCLQINALNVIDETPFNPHSIAMDTTVAFKLQFLQTLPVIHGLLQAREDKAARMMRRPPFRIPLVHSYQGSRWYSNEHNPLGYQCVCGSIRSSVLALVSPDHVNSFTHWGEVETAAQRIVEGQFEDLRLIRADYYSDLWIELLGGEDVNEALDAYYESERGTGWGEPIYERVPRPGEMPAYLRS